jgi:hypothetical protein
MTNRRRNVVKQTEYGGDDFPVGYIPAERQLRQVLRQYDLEPYRDRRRWAGMSLFPAYVISLHFVLDVASRRRVLPTIAHDTDLSDALLAVWCTEPDSKHRALEAIVEYLRDAHGMTIDKDRWAIHAELSRAGYSVPHEV